jgi:UDP-glucuronate 4-epimerase
MKFTKAILAGETIDVYNYGKHRRDFTYIDDIVEGVIRVLDQPPVKNSAWNSKKPDPSSSSAPWRVYNIGQQQPIELLDYIAALESHLGRKAQLNLLPLQPGDVPDTFADVEDLVTAVGYRPTTSVNVGTSRFISWYRAYYRVDF